MFSHYQLSLMINQNVFPPNDGTYVPMKKINFCVAVQMESLNKHACNIVHSHEKQGSI